MTGQGKRPIGTLRPCGCSSTCPGPSHRGRWVTATIVAVASIAVMVVINDSSPLIEKIIRAWSRAWLAASGTKLEVEGAENIDPNRSYVVVANHLSTLDIMACLLAVPLPIRFLAKKELFRVPVLAQGMRMVGIIEVDRQARGAVHSEVNRQSRADR